MKYVVAVLFGSLLVTAGFLIGHFQLVPFSSSSTAFPEILIPKPTEPPKPLQKYSIREAMRYPFATSRITIGKQVSATADYEEYSIAFITVGKTMSGLLTIPVGIEEATNQPIIVMVRGYVPPESYTPGIGTSPAARYFAKQGFITLAPDFFGHGASDPEPQDEWEARFIKPLSVVELIQSIREFGISGELLNIPSTQTIGIWAHSNGGQIALSALEIMGESIPTTLWAPVTAPFPYSILFFGDETEDEGKSQRAWIALFEKIYNAGDFNLTQHLDLLTGPLQIHHGTADDAALKTWSDEFVVKLDAENARRKAIQQTLLSSATPSAELDTQATDSSILIPIDYDYYVYPGADHNLRPVENWNLAVSRDLAFFERELR